MNFENPEYRGKPEMVIPRDNSKEKPVTSTKGRLALLREPVVCSELHGNQHAEAAEMAARSSIFDWRVLERREACPQVLDSGFEFGGVLHSRTTADSDVLGNDLEILSLANVQCSSAEYFEHWANLIGSGDTPHAHGPSVVASPILAMDDSPANLRGTEVSSESPLDFFQERPFVVAKRDGESGTEADPVGVTSLGRTLIHPDFSAALAVEESSKLGIPVIVHDDIVPQCRYKDESASNRTVHYHDILVSAATLGSNINSSSGYFPIEGLTEELIRKYDIRSLYDVPIAKHALMSIDASDDAVGAIFAKEAFLYLTTSNRLKTEQEHDSHLRAWDIIMTSEYGVGEVEDQWGFKMTADATAPTS